MNGYVVARYINDIALNGLEYLLDDTGEIMVFKNREEAQGYLKANGHTDENVVFFKYKEV